MAPIALRLLGSAHVGGSVAHLQGIAPVELVPVPGSPAVTVDGNGAFAFGHLYVQYAHLERPASPYPVMLWHGGGMTGACWESTPDRRPGWQSFFLRAGLDVLVCDGVERGRAGWSRFPEIYPAQPIFMAQHTAWENYRVGPADGFSTDPSARRGHPGSQFPLTAFDAFTRQIVPRWSCNHGLAQAAYDTVIDERGPCLLVAHSQGAAFAVSAVLKAPRQVKALVLLEPGGFDAVDAADLATLAQVPLLVVWGDHIDAVPFWQAARHKADALVDAVRQAGGQASTLDLPAEGVHGNSHLLMMDRNADEVAARVLGWWHSLGLVAADRT